jgi:hypothetical protein
MQPAPAAIPIILSPFVPFASFTFLRHLLVLQAASARWPAVFPLRHLYMALIPISTTAVEGEVAAGTDCAATKVIEKMPHTLPIPYLRIVQRCAEAGSK